ncbi:MAG: GTPase [Paenibacillaceae bacterium]|jgi:ribosome biogenesis GTPase YqeH|nr:GTPase [Paenibacillaceae bacterium]
MLDVEESVRCEGCGSTLQMDDPGAVGYIPEAARMKSPLICQRCFRIKNYNEMSSITLNQDDFLKMLGSIAAKKALVVHIVDIFDFEGSLIAGLQRFIGNNPVLLVVNKIDLLPKVSNWNRIRNWVQRQLKENGLKVAETVLVSAKNNQGFDRLLDLVGNLREGRDVYVVGATNVGKSTFINRLIRDHSDLEAELTVSQYPGTTLDLVEIPLEDGRSIIDTPGIVYHHRLTELLPKRYIKSVLPDKPIKPMVYQLNEGQTLFFGAMARFDFVKGNRQSFTVYMSNGVNIHRTKLERADELFAEHKGELLTPPVLEDVEALPSWIKHPVRTKRGVETEILISGLGWITVNNTDGCELIIHAPRGVKVAVRPPVV